MVSPSIVVCLALLSTAAATNVQQCEGKSLEDLSDRVQLTPCTKTPCKLKKGTDQHITITFKAEENMLDVKNHVTADIFGVSLPFIGVDGQSICSKIHTEAGEEASCPLKAGNTYVYKDSFPVLSFYPSLQSKVHWALQNDKKDLVCFEIPIKIVN